MKIETLEISGFRSALEALRLPYSLEPRSKTYNSTTLINPTHEKDVYDKVLDYSCNVVLHKKDLSLLQTLVKRGDEHAKVLRGVIVYTKITAPIYWWWDLETYRIGHERLMSGSTMNKECKGLTGEALQKAKGEISFGREITKVDYFSYQALRRIYFQRKSHRLPEFHQFCEWIKSLPYSKELITIE